MNSSKRTRGLVVALASVVSCAAAPSLAAASSSWRLAQPPPPQGAPFKTALGPPGDLQFWAANRGLLGVEGNSLIARGIYYFNGAQWRPLSVVCGGSADTMRIAWAGPDEFWTVSAPSRPRIGDGISLCHFKQGEVVGSYGTLPQSADPYQPMNAAACSGPNDCWFGGAASRDPSGTRAGAFRIHWNGTSLTTSYGPQGRAISDLEPFAGTFYESLYAGSRRETPDAAVNRTPEPTPLLLHSRATDLFTSDPFVPAVRAGVPSDGSELLALDANGERLWAVGGGAASGPAVPSGGVVARQPLVVTKSSGPFVELEMSAPVGTFSDSDRFADVAAVPGSVTAWAAVQSFGERRSSNARAKVALLNSETGGVTVERLPASGSGRGSATRVACPSAEQCWLATWAGWLFQYSDGNALPLDNDPAFERLISFRPNESAAQFVPDTPPVDDSLLLAPPPVEVEPVVVPPTKVVKIKPLLKSVRSKLRGMTLRISFTLVRKARISLIARRGGRVVARSKAKLMMPGKRSVSLRLKRKQWPTKLAFAAVEPGRKVKDDDAIVTRRLNRR